MDDMTELIQATADADHTRQPVCTDCGRGGTPYEYNGVRFDGLLAYRGDRLCSPCARAREADEGVNIRVTDRDRGIDYVYNTVRDRDMAPIWVPPELRGIDGRDLLRSRRGRRTR